MALGICGALSLLLSGLPQFLAWPGAAIAMLYGVLLARQESLKAAVAIELDGSTVDVDGEPVESFCVFWRGPLTFARWVDGSGQVRRLVWWPDTLAVVARRELRLALPTQNTARAPRSVAP